MNKYLLFSFYTHYPSGGIEDLHGSFETIEEAVKEAYRLNEEEVKNCYQIVDRDTFEIIKEENGME